MLLTNSLQDEPTPAGFLLKWKNWGLQNLVCEKNRSSVRHKSVKKFNLFIVCSVSCPGPLNHSHADFQKHLPMCAQSATVSHHTGVCWHDSCRHTQTQDHHCVFHKSFAHYCVIPSEVVNEHLSSMIPSGVKMNSYSEEKQGCVLRFCIVFPHCFVIKTSSKSIWGLKSCKVKCVKNSVLFLVCSWLIFSIKDASSSVRDRRNSWHKRSPLTHAGIVRELCMGTWLCQGNDCWIIATSLHL